MKRLGSGGPGSGNDLSALLRHDYFNSVDIGNLQYAKVPLILPKQIIAASKVEYYEMHNEEMNNTVIREGVL